MTEAHDRGDDELAAAYRAAVPAAGDHPDDAAWERLSMDEALPEERERIADHVTACRECAEVFRSIHALRAEAAAFDPAVRRWPVTSGSSGRWRFASAPLALAVAAALVVAAAWTLVSTSRTVPVGNAPATPQATSSAPTTAAPPREFLLAFAAPPVTLPADRVLAFRGESAGDVAGAEHVRMGLEHYRAARYADAASELTQVGERGPLAAEAAFYLGVSRLMLHEPAAAVAPLGRGRSSTVLAEQAEYCLAVAFERAGDREKLRAHLALLCDRPGAYQTVACEAGRRLASAGQARP